MLQQIHIVMVNTTHSGNIGAAARAMKNMGLTQLTLVDPIASIDDEAIARAAGGADILANARIVPTLADAIAECGLVVGTSARSRHIPWPLMNPRQCAAKVAEVVPAGNKVALVFGRESSGLTNEELHMCHAHVHIPSNPDYSSLNVAQAIQVLGYEMRMALVEHDIEGSGQWGVPWDYPLATHADLDGLFAHLEKALIDIDYLDPAAPKQLMSRMRRLFQRAALDKTEISILRGILATLQRQLGKPVAISELPVSDSVSQDQEPK